VCPLQRVKWYCLLRGIHVAHPLFIREKKTDFYLGIIMSVYVMHLFIWSPAFGWRDWGRLWKISGFLETVFFRIMFGVSSVYKTVEAELGRRRNKFVVFKRPHLVYSGIPEKNIYFLYLIKVKKNKSGISDSFLELKDNLLKVFT